MTYGTVDPQHIGEWAETHGKRETVAEWSAANGGKIPAGAAGVVTIVEYTAADTWAQCDGQQRGAVWALLRERAERALPDGYLVATATEDLTPATALVDGSPAVALTVKLAGVRP